MDYEAELQSHNAVLLPACAIRSHEHVLDIGCGTGQTTRHAARMAATGAAFGIDIMEPMIVRARALAAAEGVRNIRFEHGDAQAHSFAQQHYDVAISRYGTMFFADPIAAFRNIGGALRPAGRLVMMTWQAHETNAWSVAVHQALAPYESSSAVSPGAQEHFSLADPTMVERMLRAAGFANVTFSDVREPVYYGESVDAAIEWVRGFRFVRDVLQALDAVAATRLLASLRDLMTKNAGEKGVWFDAREWIVTAQRR
ncbi:MAG TPA: methyltransferase domain-containing protein [Steroidobacteraceae bacterium]|nr:methyltransferase domain-containing protein [Steroidobacteraceae bacterium]